ncbi:MAG: M20/M25/M40 family metallo-hydrolase, partial [bacterium]
EYGSRGVADVLQHLGTRQPDWVLATEPTNMRVVTAHKGVAVARIEAHGRACHSSAPSEGKNALVALARAILSLDELASRLAQKEDPRLGAGTLSVNLAAGGHATNIVPDKATLTLDRRLLPGETAASMRRELEEALARAGTESFEILSCTVAKPPLGTSDEHPAVQRCQSALARIGLDPATGVAAFGTDAGLFAEHDIPGLVLGPGSIQQAHTAREFVEIDQVECATAFFETLLRADS